MKLENANAESSLARASLPFVQALSLGDLDSATACFARDGCLITPDATAIHGRERVRPLLAQLVARRTEIKVEYSHLVAAGEVVLAQERWRVRSGGGDAPLVEQTLDPTLILRRVEAQWKLAIAAPWGRAPALP